MNRLVRAAAQCAVATIAAGAVFLSAGAASATTADDPSDKLSGRLLALADLGLSTDPAVAQAQVDASSSELGVAPKGPSSIQVSGDGIAVTVYYSSPPSDEDVAALAELGTVDSVAARYLVIGATVPADSLTAVAALPDVAHVVESTNPSSRTPQRSGRSLRPRLSPTGTAALCRRTWSTRSTSRWRGSCTASTARA